MKPTVIGRSRTSCYWVQFQMDICNIIEGSTDPCSFKVTFIYHASSRICVKNYLKKNISKAITHIAQNTQKCFSMTWFKVTNPFKKLSLFFLCDATNNELCFIVPCMDQCNCITCYVRPQCITRCTVNTYSKYQSLSFIQIASNDSVHVLKLSSFTSTDGQPKYYQYQHIFSTVTR